MGDFPHIFIKNRPGVGTYMRGDRITRFWKSKATGQIVEVKRALRDVDRNQMRVVIFDPAIGRELNMPFNKPEPNPYQPPGSRETLMDRPLTELYEPYGNLTDRM